MSATRPVGNTNDADNTLAPFALLLANLIPFVVTVLDVKLNRAETGLGRPWCGTPTREGIMRFKEDVRSGDLQLPMHDGKDNARTRNLRQ